MRDDQSAGKGEVRRNSAQFEAVCRELLRQGLAVRFTAEGESMRPNILPQDQVFVVPVDPRKLQKGEIVLAEGSDGLRVHRMVQRLAESGAAVTRGDAGQQQDAPAHEVLGRVTATARDGQEVSLERPWMVKVHAARVLARKLRLAVRRRWTRGFLALVPALVLFELFATVTPVKAVAVTLTQTASVTNVSPLGTVTYTLTLTNNSGTQTVHNPVVTQPTPIDTTYSSLTAPAGWSCTNPGVGAAGNVVCTDSAVLGTNATATITVTVQVNLGTAGQTVISGPGVASSKPTVTSTTGLQITTTITNTVTVISADLALTQTAAPSTVSPGGTLTFTNVITNNGASAAATPVLTFAIPANTTYSGVTAPGYTCSGVAAGGTGTLTCTAAADLGSGGTATIAVAVTVGAGVAGQTVISGPASVSSTTYDPTSGNNSATSSATVAVADLSLSLTALPATVAAGGTITYNITTTNSGPSAAASPQLVFATPANTVFETATAPTGATCGGVTAGNAGTLTCTSTASYPSGAFASVVVTVMVNAGTATGTVITGTPTVSSTTFDPNNANNTASASVTVGITDLGMTQTAAPSVVASGANITYTEVITDNGPAPSPNTVLYQKTPANTVFASVTAPAGWTCATPAVGGTGQVTCTDGTDFPVSTPATVTYVVTVNAATAAGTTIVNSADVTSSAPDSNPTNNATTTTVLVESGTQADIALSISAAPTPVFVSSTLTYTVLVQNLGLVTSPAVTLSDPLPGGMTVLTATPSQGPACTGTTTVSCVLGTINSGASATVVITATTPTTAQTLTNTVSYTPTTNDPVSSNNTATAITVVQPLVCAKPGNDGAGGTLNTIVNAYYAPAANGVVAAGATSVKLAAVTSGGASTGIAIGDLLLFIQMQDAAINSTNTGAYGDGSPGDPATGVTALNNSGNFEFVTATSAITNAGGTVSFTATGPTSGLLNTYTEAAYIAGTQGQRTFQVIRVPQYTSATLASGFTALPWNGSTGGVAAIDVASQLTLGGTVVLDALGFRGGGGRELTGGTGAATDYVTLSTDATNGSKGEGIAGTPIYLTNTAFTALITATVEGYPNGSYARGAPGNAGGGATDADPPANDDNTGGGAGGNGGTGGQGGYGWNSAGVSGGFGGAPFPASTSAMAPGGGGGAGTTNNGTADPANTNPAGINSSGAAGGGILIIHAGSVTGTGTITANGQTALNTLNDGPGGGGAGGSIRVLADSGGLSGLTVSANGGAGGNAWLSQAPTTPFPGERHGPGGGGGGGVLILSGTPASASVKGGFNGATTTANDAYGSTPGLPGTTATNVTIAQTPGVQPGSECAGADVSVTNTATPNPVTPGGTITYAQVVSNAGPLDALNASFSEGIPANTTFQSISAPTGWTCNSNASITATGLVTCTNADFASRAFGTFTLAVTVNGATSFGTQIVDTANVTSGTTDPNLANNTATASTVVGSASSAYVTLTKTAAAPTVVAGSSITYTIVMKNKGPAAGVPEGLYDTVPTNTTFGSISAPGGWSCSVPIAPVLTGNIACTAASLANGATATFTLVVNVNAGVANGTVISNTAFANSGIPNPNPTAASATASVTVAGATQSDLSITSAVTPNPVYSNSANPTFTQVVTNNGPAAVATATYVDTLPANATFVSLAPPAGWSCGAPVTVLGVTTVTCTGPLAVGAMATFPLVESITSADTAGTVITNSATIGPTANDPNTANNTASSSTVVASPSQADVSIVKTATPEPVDQNSNLTYTLQVTNNGPALATGVTVKDPLPSEVTFSNVSATQGTCTQSGGTVNCTLGNMSVGAVVIITINVNASTFSGSGGTVCNTVNGVPYSVCNVAKVQTTPTTLDPDTSNNSSEADSTIQSPTAVQLSSFRALLRPQGGVLLEWHTREEIRNLGFNVYREDAQGHHRVNPSIIAGAALFVRGAQPQHGAKTYYWIDAAGSGPTSYVLEDVDLNGTRTTHGPVSVEVTTQAAQVAAPAQGLSATSAVAAAPPPAPGEVANAPLLTQLNQIAPSASARPHPARALSYPRPRTPTLAPGQYRVALDLLPALKIGVQSEGWYSLSRAQLLAAGFDPGVNVELLQLYAEGVEQPMMVLSRPGARVASFESIEFYGTGVDTPFSDTRVYWLVRGTQPGSRVTRVPAAASSGTTAADFLFTVIHEDRTTYFATLLNGDDNDNFFGDAVTSEPVDEQLTVANLSVGSALPATIDVTLQGATDQQAHAVAVSFNGNPVGEMDFINQANVTNTFAINSSMLEEGVNTVALTALDGDNDVSLVQSVQLHYPHRYAADGNWLRATASSGDSLNVTGFSNAQISALDISDPQGIVQLEGSIEAQGNGFAISLGVPKAGPAEHTLLIFSQDQISPPSSLTYHAPDPAIHQQQRSDIVVISHPDFVANLTPFVALRQSQGRQVNVVTTDQIYDAFNYGERTPLAIRDYLQQLSGEPQLAPKAVFLVGEASLDPRNYLGFGDSDFVPTRIVETQAFKTATDDWFSDFQQTGFATIPTGRIPVRTTADAALIIGKIVGYESGSSVGSWNQQALLIADQNVDANFTNEAAFAGTELPASLESTRILADSLDVDTARQQILNALNNGALLVNYTGHGAEEQWSFSDLFDDTAAAGLTNGDRLPFFLLMDCLNGFFQDVYAESLAQSLMFAPNGGAVAVWASSGFTSAPPQATMDQALLRILKDDPATPLGEAVLGAKLGITDVDVRRTWIFFGDPSMQLQIQGSSAPGTPGRARPRPRQSSGSQNRDQ